MSSVMQWGCIKGSGAYSNHVAVNKYVASSYTQPETVKCITPCSWIALREIKVIKRILSINYTRKIRDSVCIRQVNDNSIFRYAILLFPVCAARLNDECVCSRQSINVTKFATVYDIHTPHLNSVYLFLSSRAFHKTKSLFVQTCTYLFFATSNYYTSFKNNN